MVVVVVVVVIILELLLEVQVVVVVVVVVGWRFGYILTSACHLANLAHSGKGVFLGKGTTKSLSY